MKKIILPIAIVMTMLFAACSSNEPLTDNTTNKCWQYTYSIMSSSVTDDFWGTAKEFGEYKEIMESLFGKVTSYKAIAKPESECGMMHH